VTPKIRFMLCYLTFVGAILVIYIFTSFCSISYLLMIFILCIPLAVAATLIVEKAGSGIGSLLTSSFKSPGQKNDEFIADLEKARHSKAIGRYDEALDLIEGVVKSTPEWPDALFLKAQIQWEGFENATDSKRCLVKVMQLVGYDETLHTWASNYFDLVVKAEKKKYKQKLDNIDI